jgi:hypothetical protein
MYTFYDEYIVKSKYVNARINDLIGINKKIILFWKLFCLPNFYYILREIAALGWWCTIHLCEVMMVEKLQTLQTFNKIKWKSCLLKLIDDAMCVLGNFCVSLKTTRRLKLS